MVSKLESNNGESGGFVEGMAKAVGSVAGAAPLFWAGVVESLRTPGFGYREVIFVTLGLLGTLVMFGTQTLLLRRMSRQSS